MGAIARRERTRRSAVRAGVVATVAAAITVLFSVTAQNGLPEYLPGVTRTSVQISFDDVGALRAGDDVRIADVRSGFVKSIDLVDGHPVVTAELNGDRTIREDAVASISARSGLGQKYLDLQPGTKGTGELSASSVIPAEQTSGPTELDDALEALDPKTRASAKTLVSATGEGAAGRGRDLNDGLGALDSLLPDLGTISRSLTADGGANLEQMLRTADVLSRSLAGQEDHIAATVQQLSDTMPALTIDDGEPIQRTIEQSSDTLRALRPALDSLNEPLEDTRVATAELQSGAEALAASVPDVRGFLTESPATLDKVPDMADSANPALDELTPTLRDAEPAVTQLATTFARAETPLSVLAPYASEVLLFFQNAASALSQGDGAGRWLRVYPVLDPEAILGTVPARLPTSSRQAYPAPNEARTHRQGSVFGEGFN